MIIGVLKESSPETRVSLLPEHIIILKKWNVDVIVENDAGNTAFAPDEKYTAAGAQISDRSTILKTANLLLQINNFSTSDIAAILPQTVVLGVYQPLFNASQVKDWAAKNIGV